MKTDFLLLKTCACGLVRFLGKPLLIFFASLLIACRLSNAATVYDVNAILASTSNPNGIWSYGSETRMGGTFALYDKYQPDGYGGFLWYSSQASDTWDTPVVGGSPEDYYVTNYTVVEDPHQVAFQPGPNGELSIFRFTTPTSGVYQVACEFWGIDMHGTTSDVHILLNDAPVFDGLVNGFGHGSGPTASTNLTLAAGDRVDFAVGYGWNGNNSFDGTGIIATLTLAAGVSNVFSPPPLTMPALNITNISGAGGVALSWSASFPGFNLESSGDLTTTNWTAVTNSVAQVDGRFVVTNLIIGPQMFFRLRQQQQTN